MARDLATTLTELDSAIHAENSAWAASRCAGGTLKTAAAAHLAADCPDLPAGPGARIATAMPTFVHRVPHLPH